MMAHAPVVEPQWPILPSRPLPCERGVRRPFFRLKIADAGVSEGTDLNSLLVLVGAAQDRAAFAALFGHFAPRIKAYLMRLGAGSAQAEDLAQEAMLTVWRKAALYDPAKASAATWIFTVARNLRIDAIRRERRPAFDPNDAAFVPDADPPPDSGLERAEDGETLRAAMEVLPPEQAEIVRMSFYSDKPHSEIARELGLPLGTVKSRLRLAMGRLRQAMGGRE